MMKLAAGGQSELTARNSIHRKEACYRYRDFSRGSPRVSILTAFGSCFCDARAQKRGYVKRAG